ncbi:MAG: TIM barrel protein [Thermoplasmata archaeon]
MSCKGRTLLDGVLDVHKLGLTAMEVQFLRTNVTRRPITDEEIGIKSRDVEKKFIIGVNRLPDDRQIFVEDLDKELEVGDMIDYLAGGIAEEFYRLPLVGQIARELDVYLTMHTPYYMKFTSKDDELVDKSKIAFKYTAVQANEMGANIINTHLGLLDEGVGTKDVRDDVVDNVRELRNWMDEYYDNPPLIGLENQAGEDAYGSLDEILGVCKQVSGTIPVINFPHIKARGEFELEDAEDFGNVLDKCKRFVSSNYYINFSGMEIRRDNYRLTPIKRGELSFEPFVDYLIDEYPEVTIISSSPLKEHDAMYMKVIFERIYAREVAKDLRRKKK